MRVTDRAQHVYMHACAPLSNLLSPICPSPRDHRKAALVNNAGIPYTIPVELLPLQELRKVFEVNCVGLVGVTQVCV